MKLDKDSILNTKSITSDFEIDFNELAKMKFDKLLHRLQALDIRQDSFAGNGIRY